MCEVVLLKYLAILTHIIDPISEIKPNANTLLYNLFFFA